MQGHQDTLACDIHTPYERGEANTVGATQRLSRLGISVN
jgi:hypothetical protein